MKMIEKKYIYLGYGLLSVGIVCIVVVGGVYINGFVSSTVDGSSGSEPSATGGSSQGGVNTDGDFFSVANPDNSPVFKNPNGTLHIDGYAYFDAPTENRTFENIVYCGYSENGTLVGKYIVGSVTAPYDEKRMKTAMSPAPKYLLWYHPDLAEIGYNRLPVRAQSEQDPSEYVPGHQNDEQVPFTITASAPAGQCPSLNWTTTTV